MDVIGVGFGRTGTASLKAALEHLGFAPCCHMMEVMADPEKVRQWRRIGEGGQPVWAEVFAGYRATVDWPGAAYWHDLVDAFPDAKVILTVRDPVKWYDSALRTIFQFPMRRHNALERGVYAMLTRVNPRAAEVPLMLDKILWERVFEDRPYGGSTADREHALELFRRHADEVTSYVNPGRLLVFDIADGWKPLCAFLGVPIPAEPFPRVNDADAFNQVIAARKRGAVVPVAVVGAVLMGAATALIAWAAQADPVAITAAGLACAALLGAGVLGTAALIDVAGQHRARRARGA
jgi:hypothetical protein